MLLVTFLAMSFPFGYAEIQMLCTIHYSRNPWVLQYKVIVRLLIRHMLLTYDVSTDLLLILLQVL